MGNFFLLSAFFSFLGLRRQQKFISQQQKKKCKDKQKSKQLQTKQKKESINKDLQASNQQKEGIRLKQKQFSQQRNKLAPENDQLDQQQKKHQKTRPNKVAFMIQEKQISEAERQLQHNVIEFILETKGNPNILYHDPKQESITQNGISNKNQKLNQLYQLNIKQFDKIKSSKNSSNQNTERSFKSPWQIKQMGCSYSILKSPDQLKKTSSQQKIVILVKEGILDYREKNITRLHQIFNLQVIQSKQNLAQLLNQSKLQYNLELHPAHIICHYSIFQYIHEQYRKNERIAKISIYNSSFMNLSQADQKLLELDEKNRFHGHLDLQECKRYQKLGVVDQKIFELRQKLIRLMISIQLKGSLQSTFSQFRYQNQQHVNSKLLGLKSCLLLQQFSKQSLLTMEQENLLQEKLKAKLDLIKLMQQILSTQFYLQYFGGLIRQQPVWVENRSKQSCRTSYEKVEEILRPIKQYKLLGFYQNHLQIDKSAIHSLQQLQELKLIPTTNAQTFWDCIQKLLSPLFRGGDFQQSFCFRLIFNYLSVSKNPLQLEYLRLYVSDLFVSIRQLYKLYDQRLWEGQCYLSLTLPQSELQLLRNDITTSQQQNKRVDRVKFQNRQMTIQNQNFIISSLNKNKQSLKQGNVLLQILISKQAKNYDNDYGFIHYAKRYTKLVSNSNNNNNKSNKAFPQTKQNQPIFNNLSKQKSKNILTLSQQDETIIFNIMNTFFVESVKYDSTTNKYVVRLLYGYVPTIINKFNTNFLNITQNHKIIAQTYFHNFKHYFSEIKSQGDSLYLAQKYDHSLVFFQQFLLKARRQPQINILKISYIHLAQFKAYKKKKNYSRALDQLSKSTVMIQKVFGQKCHHMWPNMILEAQIYQDQTYYQRGVQRLSTILHLIKAKSFQLQRKPQNQTYQNLIQLQQYQALVNMKIGVLYSSMKKQELSQNYFKRALQAALTSIGQFNPLTAQIYEKFMLFYIYYEVYQQAIFNAKKCLAIRLNLYGQHNVQTALTYKLVGQSFFKNKQYQIAHQNLLSAVKIFQQFYSEDQEEIIFLYKQIGLTLHENGSYSAGIQYLQKALDLVKFKHGLKSSPSNQLHYLIGVSYKSQGDYLTAIEYFQKSNSLSLHIISPSHQQSINTDKQIAEIYQAEGKYEKAIEFYEKPLMSVIKNKGKYHKDVIWYYEKLGKLHMNLSKLHQNLEEGKSSIHLQRSLDYFKRIVEMRYSLGKKTLQTASSLDLIGKAYLIKNDFKHALNYFDQALTIKKQLIQNKAGNQEQINLDFSISYFLMGCGYLISKQYEKSKEYLYKSLKIKLKMLSESHPEVGQIYLKLGQNQVKLNNFIKAQQLYRKALTIYLSLYGSSHPQTSYIHYLIGQMFWQKGQIIQKSLQHLFKAVETLEELGLSNEHRYFTIYKMKIIEMIEYLLQKMIDKQVQPTQMLIELKSIYFYLKKLNQCGKNKLSDFKKEIANDFDKKLNLYKQIYSKTQKIKDKLENNKYIPKQECKKQVRFKQIQDKQKSVVKKRTLLELINNLIYRLQIKEPQGN